MKVVVVVLSVIAKATINNYMCCSVFGGINCMYVTMSVYEWQWHLPCREEVMNKEVLCTACRKYDYNKLACIVSV